MSTFSGRLRALREERGLTQAEFGARLGLSKQAISTYETGGSSPDKDMLGRMADFFGVSTDYLLGRSDVRQPTGKLPDDVQFWLRHTSDFTPEQRQRLREYIEFLKFEHRRNGIRPKPEGN